ncbi:TAXI family TRAP transporter solute-binding subunit [Tropicimonas aquimaris]|uniref:TAXI family TRAP transporter solute-binding subunit n=1 Tax=Tropicimonas aquimaris TaxID=914152 RepID=A0ABW3IUP7_9RHOB
MTSSKILAAAALTGIAFCTAASAQVVSMATGAQGSLAYNSGQAVAVVANENGITVRTQPLVGYMPLLNSGEVDFGFSNGAEAAFAYTATGNFDREHTNVRLVGQMFSLTTGIMAPCDLGLETVADLKDKAGDLRIASQYTSSTIIPFYIEGILATEGLEYEAFKQVPVSSFVDGIKALGDGLVDIALVSLNSGAGQEAAVKLQNRGGLCYISAADSDAAEAALDAVLPSGIIVSLPQNENINGLQQRGASIVRVPWMLLANADVDEELVYNLISVLHQNQEALGNSFGAFKAADFGAMAPKNTMPYHPGAIRYFEEAGVPVAQ